MPRNVKIAAAIAIAVMEREIVLAIMDKIAINKDKRFNTTVNKE